jgi:hypothetical protein
MKPKLLIRLVFVGVMALFSSGSVVLSLTASTNTPKGQMVSHTLTAVPPSPAMPAPQATTAGAEPIRQPTSEGVLGAVDGRKRVAPTTYEPWSALVSLDVQFSGANKC